MYFSVDRFEGDFAILVGNNETLNVDKTKLPERVKEGDILRIVNNEYVIDDDKEKEIKERIEKKFNSIW